MARPGTARGGGDIPALALVTKEIANIRAIKDPPSDYSAGAKYRRDTEEVVNKALDTTDTVNKYAGRINEKIDELREALKITTIKVQEAITKALNGIQFTENPRGQPVPLMQYVHQLMQMEVTKQRLQEALIKTQIVVENMQNNIIVTKDDIDDLKGYMKSWQQAKKKNYEDEKREEEEARRRREEEEKRRREEEKKRREEEERRKREEEEERKRKEEEEKRRREEEERHREEAERLRKEEEDRLKREEEERLKSEEDERKMREEEEARRKLLEEEERLKQEERERREAERRAREKLTQEEEERRRRLDPNNWHTITYKRPNNQEDGSRSHHQGICSILTAVPGSFETDDVQCLASDEDRDILPALSDGEKILSSVITVESQKGQLKLEAPMRVYIPHQPVPDAGDELVCKVVVQDGDWTMTKYIPLPSKPLTDENVRLACVELDDFETAKVVVVARPRCQNIIIDTPGTSQYSSYDKNVKLFAPRDAFKKPTEVKFSVKSIPDDVRANLDSGSDCIDPIITTGPIVSLACHAPPLKDMEIDLLRSSDSLPSDKPVKGKTYQLVKTNKSGWQIADVEFKGRSKDVTITLPAMKTLYSVMELEVPQNTPKDEVLKMAGSLYDRMNKSVVRMVVKQKEDNPEHVVVHCVRRECVPERLTELTAAGYTAGPDTSREFYLFDGQKVHVSCSGNIQCVAAGNKATILPFYAYMDTAKHETVLHVRDKYKQRDLPEYIGNMHCQVLPLGCCPAPDADATPVDMRHELDIEMPVCLPKREHIPLMLKCAPVRFPHHWTALTVFLSWKLTKREQSAHDDDWFSVLCQLGEEKRRMKSRRNHAKNKSDDSSDQNVCRIMLEDWMKATNVHDDKLEPVLTALNNCDLYDLGHECQEIVDYHKEFLNDNMLMSVADTFSGNPLHLGDILGLPEETTKKCISEHSNSETLQVNAILSEWRQSLEAIEKGTKALEYLKSVVCS